MMTAPRIRAGRPKWAARPDSSSAKAAESKGTVLARTRSALQDDVAGAWGTGVPPAAWSNGALLGKSSGVCQMIRPERLTLKAQEVFQAASADARARGNPVVNDAHLFAALLTEDEGVVQPLLQKAGLNVTAIMQEIEREIARFPTQAGGTTEPTFSRELSKVFNRAETEAKA